MILFAGKIAEGESDRRFLGLLFGCGLIGSEIVARLSAKGLEYRYLPFSWSDLRAREKETRILLEHIETLARARGVEPHIGERPSIAVVWAAGRGGFLATQDEVAAETRGFEAVLRIGERLYETRPRCRHSFHLVSSAGGLFEGQTQVGPASAPRPLRAYGRNKLAQEVRLQNWALPVSKYCYRPSSVYGSPNTGHRAGLLSTLLLNGLQRRETRFFGRMDTLRDYVSNIDVAHFIAERVIETEGGGGTFTLASARPMSLLQLKVMVERTIGRKIYASYASELHNSSDMSFLPSSLPRDWRFRDVETGMRQIYRALLRK